MAPHRLSEDLASPAYSHSPCFGSSSKVNELCEPADCQSARLDVKCLREAIAQIDRDPMRSQMLQLYVRMLRQRAAYGRPSDQNRKADGQDRRPPPDSLFDYTSYTFIKQKINEP